MRQEQEQFRSVNRGGAPDGIPLGVDTNPPLRWKSIAEDRDSEERRLQEIRFSLRRENNIGRREEKLQKPNLSKHDGFVPFDEEPQEEYLFVNNYGGAWSQRMEFNRVGVERALRIAHLEGKVFLSTLAPSRSRSEAQGNELAAKRFLIFDNKTQKAEEENPYKRVVSASEGWRIEINDQRITEELTEKRLGGERLQKAFIGEFNRLVKKGIWECVWREKCSSERDRYFNSKLLLSLIFPVANAVIYAPRISSDPLFILPYIVLTLGQYGLVNGVSVLLERSESTMDDRSPNFKGIKFYRNIDHPLEYFMPRIEIDKAGRTLAYLLPIIGKGRRLVREVEGEK